MRDNPRAAAWPVIRAHLQMDWNEPGLFPGLGWSWGFDPGDLSLAVHQFGDTSFEGGHDLSQSFAFAPCGTFEARQVGDACPHSAARVAREVDQAIEDGNLDGLRVVADVEVEVFWLRALGRCDFRLILLAGRVGVRGFPLRVPTCWNTNSISRAIWRQRAS